MGERGWVGDGQERQDEERERRPDQTQAVRVGIKGKITCVLKMKNAQLLHGLFTVTGNHSHFAESTAHNPLGFLTFKMKS